MYCGLLHRFTQVLGVPLEFSSAAQSEGQWGAGHLGPGVGDELELGGGRGVGVAQQLQGVVLGLAHLLDGRQPGAVVLRPALVVVHVPLQRVLRVFAFLRLLIVLPLLLGGLVPADTMRARRINNCMLYF